jgi:hypothetical protein
MEGAEGLATSQMHRSLSAAPDASRLGLKLLNSRPLTCGRAKDEVSCRCSRSEGHPDASSRSPEVGDLTAPVCFCILASSGFLPPRAGSNITEGSQSTTEPSASPPASSPCCMCRSSNGVVSGWWAASFEGMASSLHEHARLTAAVSGRRGPHARLLKRSGACALATKGRLSLAEAKSSANTCTDRDEAGRLSELPAWWHGTLDHQRELPCRQRWLPTSMTEVVEKLMSIAPAAVPAASRPECGQKPTAADRSICLSVMLGNQSPADVLDGCPFSAPGPRKAARSGCRTPCSLWAGLAASLSS